MAVVPFAAIKPNALAVHRISDHVPVLGIVGKCKKLVHEAHPCSILGALLDTVDEVARAPVPAPQANVARHLAFGTALAKLAARSSFALILRLQWLKMVLAALNSRTGPIVEVVKTAVPRISIPDHVFMIVVALAPSIQHR